MSRELKSCPPGSRSSRGWVAMMLGIAAGWVFLIGLYVGFVR